MTTITEILAEAFNRVKAEHGVNLSGVDFEHYSGTLSGVTFKAVGNVQPVYSYPAFPPQVPGSIPWTGSPIANTVDPVDATHTGSVDVYDDCYWKFEGGVLYLWDGSGTWNTFDSGESAQRTVDSQLRSVVGGKSAALPPAEYLPATKKPNGATHVYDKQQWARFTLSKDIELWDESLGYFIPDFSAVAYLMYPHTNPS